MQLKVRGHGNWYFHPSLQLLGFDKLPACRLYEPKLVGKGR
jgi:hypothetical protein